MSNCTDERMETKQLMVVYSALIAFLHGIHGIEIGSVEAKSLSIGLFSRDR